MISPSPAQQQGCSSTRSSSTWRELMLRSTIYTRHEARRARTLQKNNGANDPRRRAVIRVVASSNEQTVASPAAIGTLASVSKAAATPPDTVTTFAADDDDVATRISFGTEPPSTAAARRSQNLNRSAHSSSSPYCTWGMAAFGIGALTGLVKRSRRPTSAASPFAAVPRRALMTTPPKAHSSMSGRLVALATTATAWASSGSALMTSPASAAPVVAAGATLFLGCRVAHNLRRRSKR